MLLCYCLWRDVETSCHKHFVVATARVVHFKPRVHTGDKVEFNTVDFVECRLIWLRYTMATTLTVGLSVTVDFVADLSPVSATVYFQQSRPCWTQLYRQCAGLPGFRIRKLFSGTTCPTEIGPTMPLFWTVDCYPKRFKVEASPTEILSLERAFKFLKCMTRAAAKCSPQMPNLLLFRAICFVHSDFPLLLPSPLSSHTSALSNFSPVFPFTKDVGLNKKLSYRGQNAFSVIKHTNAITTANI